MLGFFFLTWSLFRPWISLPTVWAAMGSYEQQWAGSCPRSLNNLGALNHPENVFLIRITSSGSHPGVLFLDMVDFSSLDQPAHGLGSNGQIWADLGR